MARFMHSLSILIAAWCVLSNVTAQSNPTTPITCPNAVGMANVNVTQFVGQWYEVARMPAGSAQCILIDLSVSSDNKTLTLKTTSAANLNQLSSNMTMSDNIDISSSTNAVYNVTYTMGTTTSKTNTTIKLLGTDYKNYAFICGYTNASDPTTYFGAVLTRERVPAAANLTQYETNATRTYANFSTNMPAIIQSAKCTNAASTTLPIFSTFFVALYAILKYLN